MAEDNGDKSLDPTPRRRQQARERGQVAHSGDLSSAGLLLGGLVVLLFTGSALVDFLARLLAGSLGGQSWMQSVASGGAIDIAVVSQWHELLPGLARMLLPTLGLVLLLAVGLDVLQKGIWFLPWKLAPDFSRIHPGAGLSRIFSRGNAVRLAFGIFKILVVGGVALWSLYGRRYELMSVSALELPQLGAFIWDLSLSISLKAGLALAVLAILDYGYQRWRFEQELKMTPQEMREEMRNLQGDPAVVARRRGMQRQLATHRMSDAVRTADVVISGPGRVAVALKYHSETMSAPTVVAKGRGVIATRIRDLAAQSGVTIVEKQELGEALFKQVSLQRSIPGPLFTAVAEVLAYAHEIRGPQRSDADTA